MTNSWANRGEVERGGDFDALHLGLTVQMIATRRERLVMCKSDDTISTAVQNCKKQYDFLPVIDSKREGEEIVGLLRAQGLYDNPPSKKVSNLMLSLSEEYLVGADTSILDFVINADKKPCRLVVAGSRIDGLATLSDLQKLPVRATLFALVTGFELTLFELIRRKFSDNDAGWLALLNDGRQQKIREEIEKSEQAHGHVDSLLFSQFCDKADIVVKSFPFPQRSKNELRRLLGEIQDLRDNLAHANQYAATPDEAKQTCRVVRSLLELRKEAIDALT